MKKQTYTKYPRPNPFKKIRKPKTGSMYVLIACVLFVSVIILLPTAIVQMKGNSKTGAISEEVEQITEIDEEETIVVSVDRSETNEVENVPLEDYVFSVVAAEMPAHFAEEALKAQAVAARTYVVKKIQQDGGEIQDTTNDQVYKNEKELKEQWQGDFEANRQKIKEAVHATKNEIMVYEDELITPTFFSMSNGYTENAEDYWGESYPYLQSVESKWEESVPSFAEQETFTWSELNEQLGVDVRAGETPAIQIERTDSNRVKQIQVKDKQFTGKEVREKLHLRSSDFTIVQHGDNYMFTTKGYGHGVGMSQYGANGMAAEGKTYADILHYYYQDIELKSIADMPDKAQLAFR